ncbi:MAG: mevalonate kinase [Nitrososphaerota archaeon]|nr:mevalonate kinase [Nitrososphaerota archaeon]
MVHGGSALAVALCKWVEATAVRSEKNTITSINTRETAALDDAVGFLEPCARCANSLLEARGWRGVSITINSDVPSGSGLGSSAATSVAVLASVATLFNSPLDPAQLYEYAMIGEKLVHGRPSGIDAFVSINGGLVKVRGNKREVVGCPPFWLMVSDSGESRNTGDMVRRVSEYRNMNRESFETLLRATEALVDDSVEALRRGDISILAQGMNFNQEALRLVGASTEKIDTMVRTARAVGFTGAKLTGAGGGGCIIAVQAPDPQKSFENFRANYPSSFLCSVPGEGVKTWLF